MDKKLIAVVDDDPDIIRVISEYLTKLDYIVKGFPDEKGFFDSIDKEKPDVILLDIMLPGVDGFEVCRRLKENERFSAIPVIMLSGKGDVPDKVFGLDKGADDYLVKPFSLDELNARIKAVLRRQGPAGGEGKISVGDKLEIDQLKHEVTVYGEKVELTLAEFRILELLTSKKEQVFTRSRILDYLWGVDKVVTEQTIDVHIRHLREKLGVAGKFIKNVRGIGYKLQEGEDEED